MRLSIIIPTINEAPRIVDLISYLQIHGGPVAPEIIVVDGGSSDDTVALANRQRARVLRSPHRQRAYQMNLGAAAAMGDVLYFLHADTFPPRNYVQAIDHAVKEGSQAGCFRLAFDWNHWFLRLQAWFTRYDWDGFHYGDQSLFILKSDFTGLGGFDESLDIMEDYQMVRRLKQNLYFTVLPAAVRTSARRYRQVGVYKLQLIYYLIFLMFRFGFSQRQLWKVYRFCFVRERESRGVKGNRGTKLDY